MASNRDEHEADDETRGDPDGHPRLDPSTDPALTKPVGPFATDRVREGQHLETDPRRDAGATARLDADIFGSPTDPALANAPDASISWPKGDEIPPSETDEIKAPLAPGPVQPGQTLFGRYRVERPLGEGGMGTVWLVRHLELDTPRAVKLIIPQFAFDPQARARFKREARLMARLAHPNAVTVHAARMAADAAFIEMEYVAGGTLSRRLEPGVPAPLDWVTRILDQLCDVVQTAHDLGIVHRDLKPSNLMLVEKGTTGRDVLKVADFGLAKIFDPERQAQEDIVTRSGRSAFTPHYASPEQISGHEVDGRSDIYSIGVILYELLAGCRPFGGNGVLYHQLCTPPPPMAKANPRAAVPPAVERVVLWCLAKDAAGRPQSAHELAEAFHRALAESGLGGAGTTASPTSTPPAGGRESVVPGTEPAATGLLVSEPATAAGATTDVPGFGRRKWLIGAAVLLALGSVGLVAATSWNRGPKPGPPTLPPGYQAEAGTGVVGHWPRVIVRKSDGARFLRLEGGTFAMGDSSVESAPGGKARRDERPAHRVALSDYYIQETEVTNAQMEAYFRARKIEHSDCPKHWLEATADLADTTGKPDHYPAVGIPHQMADDYARWVGGRLPTEAQWEYAARSRGQDRTYVWGNNAWKPGLAILSEHGDGEHPVVVGVTSDRTEQEVADLAGNVREWCRDVYAPYATSAEPVRDPSGPPVPADTETRNDVIEHVVRGGSYRTFPDAGRTTGPRRPSDHDGSDTLEQVTKDGTADDLGFRVVIEWPARPSP
jgi:formylglycine-generating enzyme required for sulfatase activity